MNLGDAQALDVLGFSADGRYLVYLANVHDLRGELRDTHPSPGDHDADRQRGQHDRGDHQDRHRDRDGLREQHPAPRERQREDQAEAPVLLLPGRRADDARDRAADQDQRPVEREDLRVQVAGQGAEVAAAEQAGDPLPQVEVADAPAERREQGADQDHHGGEARAGDERRPPAATEGHLEDPAVHDGSSSR